MKIGLTGPSGSGKTTLANYIERTYNLQFLPGSASLITDPEHQKLLREKYNYEPTGHKNVINLSNSNPEFGYDFQRLLLESRMKAIKENDNIVTDRTFIDNVAYFLMQCSHNQKEETVEAYINQAVSSLEDSGLTHIILIKPNNDWTEDNGSRVANNYYQHMSYSVFLHVWKRYFVTVAHSLGIKFLNLDMWDLRFRKSLIDDLIS